MKSFKRLQILILPVVFLLGFVVRLYKIDGPVADWHSFRQADTASVSRVYVENGVNLLFPKYHDISRIQSGIFNPQGFRFVEFPLYNALHAIFAENFTFLNFEVWGRLISILSALGTGYLLYLLGRQYISHWGGVIASAFFLLNPYNIFFTRVILPEPLAVFFAVLALYFFSKFDQNEKYTNLFLSALMLAISILIKPYTVFYGLPILVRLLEKNGFKKLLLNTKILMIGFVAIAPFFLWRAWISSYPEGIPFWKWTFNGDGIRFRPAYWYWVFGERLTKLILGFWGLIPFAIGLMAYDKKRKFIHTMILGMLFFVMVIATANVRHDYYQSITVPAISLVFALGVVKLWNLKDFDLRMVRGITAFSIAMMLVASAFQAKEYYKINHPEIIEAGNEVDRITPKDAIIIAAYYGDTAFLYHTKRRGYPNVELPIEELIDEGARYYASVDLGSPQTKEFEAKFETLKKTDKYVILKLK